MILKEQSYSYLRITLLPCILVSVSSCQTGAQPAEFSPGQATGMVTSEEITEASGMVASRKQNDVLWIHNDSGHSPTVYAVTPQGTLLASYRVMDATLRDWEDIALGPGPEPGQDYLYIGDIGDNQGRYASITVYRVKEPHIQSRPTTPALLRTDPAQALHLIYPDGARDAETLLIDPLTKDIYIITKRELASRVYWAPFPHATDRPITLKFMTPLPWRWATGGDVAPDGQAVLVRSIMHASRFQRIPGEPLWKAFGAPHQTIPIRAHIKGEAICFDAQGRGYYSLNEGKNPSIYYYRRTPPSDDTEKN